MGIKGINVKRKIIAGGIAITKLKAIAEALSVIPIVFTCPIKKLITSNSGMPLNPGREVDLLFLIIKATGAEASMLVNIFFKSGIFI